MWRGLASRARPRTAASPHGDRRVTTAPAATGSYSAAVNLQPVRDAYTFASGQYIDLCGGDVQNHDDEAALVRKHLAGTSGPVFDLGCGPGHWTAYLHSLGTVVVGVDMVPEFVAHARATHPGPGFRLGSMTKLDVPAHSVAGILAWYSTIHVPPSELDQVLAGFRRLLTPAGVLVAGFFDSDDDVAAFDHAVTTAYRWPADVFADRLAKAGLTEVERLQHQSKERPDRRYAAIAARAS